MVNSETVSHKGLSTPFLPLPTPTLICKLLIMNNLTRVLLKLNLPPAVLAYPYPITTTCLKTLEKEEK